jgi:hypothetical protein
MITRTISISDLTHSTNSTIREVEASQIVAIVKKFNKEVCALLPIAEYNRLKAFEPTGANDGSL